MKRRIRTLPPRTLPPRTLPPRILPLRALPQRLPLRSLLRSPRRLKRRPRSRALRSLRATTHNRLWPPSTRDHIQEEGVVPLRYDPLLFCLFAVCSLEASASGRYLAVASWWILSWRARRIPGRAARSQRFRSVPGGSSTGRVRGCAHPCRSSLPAVAAG